MQSDVILVSGSETLAIRWWPGLAVSRWSRSR